MKKFLRVGAGVHTPKSEHWLNLDIIAADNIDVVADLNKAFPFPDNSFMHISAIHVVEHLQNLPHFMDECWRILQNGCSLYIETPLAGGDPDLEFCDPTHIRCYRPYTMHNYFSPEGVEKFRYTERPWCILKNEVRDNIIYWHLSTIKNLNAEFYE